MSGAPVSYAIDGRQYIAVTAGGGAAQTSTLGRLVDVDITEGSGVIWVFSLPQGSPGEVPRPVRAEISSVSVSEGVFSNSQAEQGLSAFSRHCSQCHEAGNYAGQALQAKWGGFTLADIYSDISVTMPPSNPGGLSADEYVSIIAYLLRESGYSPGSQNDNLPPDQFQLTRYKIDVPGLAY